MTRPLAGHGRRVGFAHHPHGSLMEGLLTRRDGGDALMAVRIGPLSAWRPEEQALVAGLAGDRAYTRLSAMDGFDGQVMAVVDDGPAGVFDKLWQSCAEIRRTLSDQLKTLKVTYNQRAYVST
jgi:hypothetical protein